MVYFTYPVAVGCFPFSAFVGEGFPHTLFSHGYWVDIESEHMSMHPDHPSSS